MRISDWSSDVCSSDLVVRDEHARLDPEGSAQFGEIGLLRLAAIGGVEGDGRIPQHRRAVDALDDAVAEQERPAAAPVFDVLPLELGGASSRERGCQYV